MKVSLKGFQSHITWLRLLTQIGRTSVRPLKLTMGIKAYHKTVSFRKAVLERNTSTGSEIFSLLICLVVLSVFTPVLRLTAPKFGHCHCPKMQHSTSGWLASLRNVFALRFLILLDAFYVVHSQAKWLLWRHLQTLSFYIKYIATLWVRRINWLQLFFWHRRLLSFWRIFLK